MKKLVFGSAILILAVGTASAMDTRITPRLAQLAPATTPLVDTELTPGIALSGYDPVSYFTAGAPTEGKVEFTLRHRGAEWRFASAANRDAFRAAPAKFAPQYGGYCSWAVAGGYTAKGDPQAWKIVGGKLYLNYDLTIKAKWEEDIPGNLTKSEANWPGIIGRK